MPDAAPVYDETSTAIPSPPAVIMGVYDVCKSFGSARRMTSAVRAVDAVNFEVRRGETFGLVGESGCGKSTLARLISGLLLPDSGAIAIKGTNIATMTPGMRRGHVSQTLQMVFQDPFGSLNPRWHVRDIIAEPMRTRYPGWNRQKMRARVDELLSQVSLATQDGEKFPHEFSGGQRQRISIARALAASPELIIFDEPTSALDVSVQAQILGLMKDLQRELNLTYLFISHDLAVVEQMSDRVGVMYAGRIIEQGEVTSVFAKPRHPYTKLLLSAVSDSTQIGWFGDGEAEPMGEARAKAGCAFQNRCSIKSELCLVEVPVLKRSGPAMVACHMDR